MRQYNFNEARGIWNIALIFKKGPNASVIRSTIKSPKCSLCVLCCFQITFNSTSKATSRSSLAGKGSLDSAVSHGHQMFTKVVTYEGQSLAVKVVHKQYIAVTKDVIKEINEVHIPTKVTWSEFQKTAKQELKLKFFLKWKVNSYSVS